MRTAITNEHLRREFDSFEKTGELGNMIEELQYSTLIVPVDKKKEFCALMEACGRIFIPAFTDIHEYHKADIKGDFFPRAFDFSFYLDLLKMEVDGIIINVEAEMVPITKDVLDVIDTSSLFDLDYRTLTANEIRDVYDSMDNGELEEFLKDEENRWDRESLMGLLLKSDILAVIGSSDKLDEVEDLGVVVPDKNTGYCRTDDGLAVIFSSPDKIVPPQNGINYYSQLVNLPLFIDFVLKSDLEGLKLDEEIVLSRDFLIGFMKSIATPCTEKYDDYAFVLGD